MLRTRKSRRLQRKYFKSYKDSTNNIYANKFERLNEINNFWQECKVFENNIIVCRENPKDSIDKWLKQVRNLSRVAGNKVNTQKNQ